MKHALITGITGQAGTYLAELLLLNDYRVYGLIRGQANGKRAAVEALLPQVQLIEGDLLDQASLVNAVRQSEPDEVYNLAAISFVPTSWGQPDLVAEVTGLGVLRMLEAVRIAKKGHTRFYQASSSEMFGKVLETPQRETTALNPRSPYGCAKAYGHYITRVYRDSYQMFTCSGMCLNYESPRRGFEFLTRKVTRAAARIKLGKQDKLKLGNLDARRDWTFMGDAVRAMYLMLQHDTPDDYVIGSGTARTVREFVATAFGRLDLDWERYVEIDPAFIRPAEVDLLVADASKARTVLGWRPTVSFEDLVAMMVDNDLRLEQAGAPYNSLGVAS